MFKRFCEQVMVLIHVPQGKEVIAFLLFYSNFVSVAVRHKLTPSGRTTMLKKIVKTVFATQSADIRNRLGWQRVSIYAPFLEYLMMNLLDLFYSFLCMK